MFVMLIGVSGSGKSTYAKQYFNGYLHLSSDAIRKELWGSEEDQREPSKVFQVMNDRAEAAVREGKNVVYDATNLNRKRRIALLHRLKDADRELRCTAIVFATPIEECITRRQQEDARKVPEYVIMKQLKDFQMPFYDEGFTFIDVVRPSAVECAQILGNLFYKCMHTRHDNPHHADESIFDHLHNVSATIRAITGDDENRVGYYHDIGKPFCKTFDENGVAHYYQHENVSAYFSLFRDESSLCAIITDAYIISLHMRKFSFKDDSSFKQWLRTLPPAVAKRLEILTIADKVNSIEI